MGEGNRSKWHKHNSIHLRMNLQLNDFKNTEKNITFYGFIVLIPCVVKRTKVIDLTVPI